MAPENFGAFFVTTLNHFGPVWRLVPLHRAPRGIAGAKTPKVLESLSPFDLPLEQPIQASELRLTAPLENHGR